MPLSIFVFYFFKRREATEIQWPLDCSGSWTRTSDLWVMLTTIAFATLAVCGLDCLLSLHAETWVGFCHSVSTPSVAFALAWLGITALPASPNLTNLHVSVTSHAAHTSSVCLSFDSLRTTSCVVVPTWLMMQIT